MSCKQETDCVYSWLAQSNISVPHKKIANYHQDEKMLISLGVLIFFISAVLDKAINSEEAAILPFKQQCLKWHNEFRRKHQADPVTWNDDLTKGAQTWANILAENNTFEHEKNIHPGENLYLSGKPIPKESCTEATKHFYGEVKDYDFDKPGYSIKTGYFISGKFALAWKNTKEIGAAKAIRGDGRQVVVIRYSPSGNYPSLSAFKENVVPQLDKSGVGQARSSLIFIDFAVGIGAPLKTFF